MNSFNISNSGKLARIVTAMLAILCLGSILQAAPSKSKKMNHFGVDVTVDPIFPGKLQMEGYKEGNVSVLVVVDSDGILRDFLVIEADHVLFAEAVERVIENWSFDPPILDGEPVNIVRRLNINISAGDLLSFTTTSEMMGNMWGNKIRNRRYYVSVVDPHELDKIPEPITVQKPSFNLKSLKGKDHKEVVFEFYIDKEGNVRMPTVSKMDSDLDEAVIIAAQNALMNWKFEPPTKSGKPVLVKFAQPFRFQAPVVATNK